MNVYLRTPRLILREFTAEDLELLVDLDSDPEVMRYLTGGIPSTREFVRDRVLPDLLAFHAKGPDFGFWAALEARTREFLGWFHFRPPHEPLPGMELGYRLKRACWGQGLATEGSRAIIRKAFEELGVERILAKTLKANLASRRVMEKAGLRLVEEFVEPRIDPPQPAVWYALDRADYPPTP